MKKLLLSSLTLFILMYSCKKNNLRETDCQVCGTWKLDSIIDSDGMRNYFNLDTFPFKKRLYTFTEDKIYYVEDNDTIVWTVQNNSVLKPIDSKINWSFNSNNETFFIQSINTTNLIFKDDGSSGSYQTNYLTKQ